MRTELIAIAIAVFSVTGTVIAADQPLPGQSLCIVTAKQQVNGSWTAVKEIGQWDVKTSAAGDALQMMMLNDNIQERLQQNYRGQSIFYECMSEEGVAAKRVDLK